jgi:lipid-A-disaccharide synthase
LCKLPFEVPWFSERNCRATYVGHPYFDQLANQEYDQAFLDSLVKPCEPLLTLLPGSRDQEVEFNLPILLDAAEIVLERQEKVRVAVACFNEHQKQLAESMLSDRRHPVSLYVGKTPELIKSASVCVACSGSVSLELLYHRKPTVIVYRLKPSMMVAQSVMLRIKYITLVNLIATSDIRKTSWRPYDPDAPDAEVAVMPEYLTTRNPADRIAGHASEWLSNSLLYDQKVAEMNRLAERFAIPGATERAAAYIMGQLSGAGQQDRQVGFEAKAIDPDAKNRAA